MPHRNNEEAVASIRDTSKSGPPSQESSQQCEEAAGTEDLLVRLLHFIAGHITNAQQKECQIDGSEEGEEDHGRLDSAQQHEEGEYEPAL